MVSINVLGSVGATIVCTRSPAPRACVAEYGKAAEVRAVCWCDGRTRPDPGVERWAQDSLLARAGADIAADRYQRMMDVRRRVAHPHVTATVTEGPDGERV